MQWVNAHRRERRWWTMAAITASLGLIVGVLGVVPAFADLEQASCIAIEDRDGVTVTWDGVPADLELILLAESGNGDLTTVSTDGAGDVIGFGASGSWSGAPHPGAVRYHIHAPADGGGTLACTAGVGAVGGLDPANCTTKFGYHIQYHDGLTDTGCASNNTVTRATHPDLIATELHISCSDDFIGAGITSKSNLGDPDRYVTSYTIWSGGKIKCTGTPNTTPPGGGNGGDLDPANCTTKFGFHIQYHDGLTDTGCASNNTVTRATHPDLIATELHVSCSDDFIGAGITSKSNLGDPDRYVTSYTIWSGGKIKCTGTPNTTPPGGGNGGDLDPANCTTKFGFHIQYHDGLTDTGCASNNTVTRATHPDLIATELHVSCSDDFIGAGITSKSNLGDPDRYVTSYTIWSGGKIKCTGTPNTTPPGGGNGGDLDPANCTTKFGFHIQYHDGLTDTGCASNNTVTRATHPDLIATELHVSCSDDFIGAGITSKSNLGDPDRYVTSYTIWSGGKIKCTGTPNTTPPGGGNGGACGEPSTIESGFNGTSIAPGSWIWFNSHAKIDTLGKSRVFLGVRSASANIDGTRYPLPDADITLSTAITSATISWDAARNRWIIEAPISDAGKDVFLTGIGIPLPDGLSGGAGAGFDASFSTDTPGLGLSWQWSAAVYTQFSADPAALGVLPVDGDRQSGTPMNYREFVTGGARGGGGSNFTGSNSATRSVTPEPCEPDTSTPTPTPTPIPAPTPTPIPGPTPTPIPAPTPTPIPAPTPTTPPTPTPEPTPTPPDDPGIAELSSTIVDDCELDIVRITVRNTGSAAGTAEIVVDDVLSTVLDVPAGSEMIHEIPRPGLPVVVQVVGEVGVIGTALTSTCEQPAPDVTAEAWIDCAAGELVVTLVNDGTATALVSIDVDGIVTEVRVEPGGQERIEFGAMGATTDISIESDGTVLLARTLESSCTDPAPALTATIAATCISGADAVTVVVDNGGDAPGDVTIRTGATEQVLTVAARDSASVTAFFEGEIIEASVTDAAGQILATFSGTSVCERPESRLVASISLDCAAGVIVIEATNDGTATGTLFVDVDGTTQAVSIRGAQSSTIRVPVVVGAMHEVVVHDGDQLLVKESFEDVCRSPRAVLSAKHRTDCSRAITTVTLGNTGDAAANATISLGADLLDVRVAPGETIDIEVPTPADGGRLVVATADGDESAVLSDTLLEPCESGIAELAALSTVNCAAGEVTVAVINSGDAPGTVTVAINDTVETLVVAPGTTVTRVADVEIGGPTNTRVEVDGTVLVDEQIAETCPLPEAEIRAQVLTDCVERTIAVRLVNGGAQPGTAEVSINTVPHTVEVPARSSIVIKEPLGDAGTSFVNVSVNGTPILTEQETATCGEPSSGPVATIELLCTYGEAVVTVVNDDSAANTIVLSIGGQDRTVELAAGEAIQQRIPLDEDEAFEISVSLDGGELLAFTRGTFDCDNAQVLNASIVRSPATVNNTSPMSLPRTGLNSGALAGAGIVLLAAGWCMRQAATIRRERLQA
jgi:hypothetical protein